MRRGVVAALILPPLVQGEIKTITWNYDGCSSNGSLLDYAGLVCVDCDRFTGLQPDMILIGHSDDIHECKCPLTSLQAKNECSVESMWHGMCQELGCSTECDAPYHVASLDQKYCVLCSTGDTTYKEPTFDVESKVCSCNNPKKSAPTNSPIVTNRLVEIYDDSGLPIGYDCMRCPKGTAVISVDLYDEQQFFSTVGAKYHADPTVCASCPDRQMYFDTDYSCRCPDYLFLTGEAAIGTQSCIERYPTVMGNFAKAIFQRPVALGAISDIDDLNFSLESIVYSHFYVKSASLCEYFKGISDESLKACQVLGNLCVMSNYQEESVACKQYLSIASRRQKTYHNQDEWKQTLPWLYYTGKSEDVVNDNGIKMKMAFNKDNNYSTEISFRLAKYRLNGSFVGMEDMSNQLKYCSNDTSVRWKKFGNSYRLEYLCSIEELIDREMFFYDMYVVDNDREACTGDSVGIECLYPVPVLNRNFIEEGIFPNMNLGIQDERDDRYTRRFFLFDNQSGMTSAGVEAIRYAKSIFISIQVQSDNPNQLTPPRLIIEYETKVINLSQKESLGSDLLLFKVGYSMKTETFWDSIQILLGFVSAFAILVYGVKINNWQSRQQPQQQQQQENNLHQNDESFTSMTFIVHATMTLCHVFVLIFFPFVVAICSYWYIFFKMQDSVFLLLPLDNEFYLNAGNEYHFLMLSLKVLFLCQTLSLFYTIIGQCRNSVILIDWERSKGQSNNQVSTWRKVFVANEFLSIQTSRKHNISFNLALLCFFVTFDDVHSDHANIALRFASTSFVWFLASGIQWLWRFLFYERWYNEPRGQRFVDLCTVCNISIFLLTESFKGHYIHGRSPHQFSDCSMNELLESFRKEANGFTVSRGLDASSQGEQVFIFFCSSVFRNQINKIYNFINVQCNDEGDSKYIGITELSNFLKGFVDQQPLPVHEGLKYVVKEALISETVLGITPPDFRQSDPKCIMIPDSTNWNRDYEFLATTFVGIEMDLLLHDILTYTVVDLLFSSFTTSIFITYLMHLARTQLAYHFAKRNLAKSSHIDERFLF